MNSQELRNLQEAYLEVYENIMEKEDSPYEKASDAALDSRYGYGRATGDKHSFGRAANRSSAAAALRAIRRDERRGSETSREAGSNAVHQGWARTARTSTDQTPEKKERRAGLANTPYSELPDDEKEKDRVSFDAVRAVYNRKKTNEEYDLYDIILSHLLDEGYADTIENAESIMVNMSEDWRESIVEDEYKGDPRKIPTENGGSKPKDKLVVPPVPVLPPPTRPAPISDRGGGSISGNMPPPAPRGGGSIRSMPPKDGSAGSITLNRNKPGDDFIGPTVSSGGNTYGIPNPKFGRPQR
jgi:hypothetical protein